MSCAEGYLASSLRRGHRSVAFATAGLPSGWPVLFFYPLGSSRRQLALLHERMVENSIWVICVNRPGMHGTSPAVFRDGKVHLQTACQDIVAVLEELRIDQVSLLFMCAGTPYALAFAALNPERITGSIVGVAPWVSPAMCPSTKRMYRIGSALPSWVNRAVVATGVAVGTASMSSVPDTWVKSFFDSSLSPGEREFLTTVFPDAQKFAEVVRWTQEETGGQGDDLDVLLSDYSSLGLPDPEAYPMHISLYHGESDAVIPGAAAHWFSDWLGVSLKSLNVMPAGTHQGMIFMLHTELDMMLKSLVPSKDANLK